MFFLEHIWLIPLFPALGAACMFFFGRKLDDAHDKKWVNGICVGVVVLAFLWTCGSVYQYTQYAAVEHGKPFEKVVYTWLGSNTGLTTYPRPRALPPSSRRKQDSFSTRSRRSGCSS